jgi:hypothetical protein
MSEPSDKAPDSGPERRSERRHFACFPAHIQKPSGSTRMALIHDLSVTGALLLTRSPLEVGEEVRLSLYLKEDTADARAAVAKVLRVEPRDADHSEVWHHSVAVQFAEPLGDCAAEIADIAAHQAALGVPRD